MRSKTESAVALNIRVHNAVSKKYEKRHGEIFNPVEQNRLKQTLASAVEAITTNSQPRKALDFGCGSGNLTSHLIDLDLEVTASDVSPKFLQLVSHKFNQSGKLKTLELNGENLNQIDNDTFDFVATYSVLHHVPDYLAIIDEMLRVLKPGGILYLDHEVNENYWKNDSCYVEYLEKARPKPKPKTGLRFLNPINYYKMFITIFFPNRNDEGDIHTTAGDHIEWSKIENQLLNAGCSIVMQKDYLLYSRGFSEKVHQEFSSKCSDMRVLFVRKA